MTPDERAFRADIQLARFRVAVADERWSVISIAWPLAYIGVTASDGEVFVLRFQLQGYPVTPPTSGPWDMAANCVLPFARWPISRGGRLGAVFRPDWKGGTALYLPCDRLSIEGHAAWRTQMPSKIWQPSAGINLYLELVYELLNSGDYSPRTVPKT